MGGIAARMRERMRRADPPDEQGAALILALVFVVFVSLVGTALLGLGDASVSAAGAYRRNTDQTYAATGAAESAIASLRHNQNAGRETSPNDPFDCFEYQGMQVTCQALSGSGAPLYGAPDSVPQFAILTLGRSEDGYVQTLTNDTVNVQGDVLSNSDVTGVNFFTDGQLEVDGNILARGACGYDYGFFGRFRVTASGSQDCNVGNGTAAQNALLADPGWAPEVDIAHDPVPTYRVPPTPSEACNASTHYVATLQPGFYDDVSRLNALVDSSTPCHTVWFQPGVYYFDFKDFQCANAIAHGAVSCWDVDNSNVHVVAGIPKGWDPATGSTPPDPPPAGSGACKTETDLGAAEEGLSPTQEGVQFVFGGESSLEVRRGHFELCAPPHNDRQQIGIYGLPHDGADPGTQDVTLPVPSPPAVSGSWTNPAGAVTIGDGSVAAVSPPSADSTHTLTFSAFPSIPPGSTIQSVSLVYRHRETNTHDQGWFYQDDGVSIRATTAGSSRSASPSMSSSWRQDSLDLTSLVGGRTDQLGSLQVTYEATRGSCKQHWHQLGLPNCSDVPTFQVDGLELHVTYTPPRFHAQSGCTTQTGGSGLFPSGCPTFSTANDSIFGTGFPNQTWVGVHGTIYTPKGRVEIGINNNSTTVASRGIVARRVNVGAVFSGAPDFPLVSNNTSTTFADRRVRMTVAPVGVDPATDPSEIRLQAVVRFGDDGGTTPGQSVTIEQWNVAR